jgi:hypothetical protein
MAANAPSLKPCGVDVDEYDDISDWLDADECCVACGHYWEYCTCP